MGLLGFSGGFLVAAGSLSFVDDSSCMVFVLRVMWAARSRLRVLACGFGCCVADVFLRHLILGLCCFNIFWFFSHEASGLLSGFQVHFVVVGSFIVSAHLWFCFYIYFIDVGMVVLCR